MIEKYRIMRPSEIIREGDEFRMKKLLHVSLRHWTFYIRYSAVLSSLPSYRPNKP